MVAASNLRCGQAVRPSEIAGLNSRSPRIGASSERTAGVRAVGAGHPAASSRQISKTQLQTQNAPGSIRKHLKLSITFLPTTSFAVGCNKE
jgi:hypothetical protein